MKVARIVNAIFWIYIWLSGALLLLQVTTPGDFWVEKGKQLFRLNPNVDDPARLFGNAIPPFFLWCLLDWILRRSGRTKPQSEPKVY